MNLVSTCPVLGSHPIQKSTHHIQKARRNAGENAWGTCNSVANQGLSATALRCLSYIAFAPPNFIGWSWSSCFLFIAPFFVGSRGTVHVVVALITLGFAVEPSPKNSVFGRGFTRWSCSPGGVVHQVESILGKKTPQSSPRAETFTQLRNTWICDSQAAGHKQEHPHARGLTQFGTRIHLTHPSRHQMPQYRGGTGLTKCPKMSS